eukprot:1597945-Rhodomonas_salina.1
MLSTDRGYAATRCGNGMCEPPGEYPGLSYLPTRALRDVRYCPSVLCYGRRMYCVALSAGVEGS